MTDEKPTTTSTDAIGALIAKSAQNVCRAVDASTNATGSRVSYISSSETVTLRPSQGPISTTVLVVPNSEQQKPSSSQLRDRLIDLGVDCGIALPLSFFATAASCGGTVVTLGATTPLCAISVVGTGSSSLSCGNAIGKMINHAVDPRLNEHLARSEMYQNYETALGVVDAMTSFVSIAKAPFEIRRLASMRGKFVKDIKGLNFKESFEKYKDLSKALGETFSNSGVKKWINRMGFHRKYNASSVTPYIDKYIGKEGLNLSGTSGIRRLACMTMSSASTTATGFPAVFRRRHS